MKKYLLLPALLLTFALAFIACEEKEPDDKMVNVTDDITVNTLWLASKVYYIDGIIGVSNGATLTIEPGTVIKFSSSGTLEVGYSENATLIASGTPDKPITFTSSAQNPTPGAWEYIYFGENALQNSILNYCIIEYAGKDPWYGAMQIDGSKISVTNCTFRSNSGAQTIHVRLTNADNAFVAFSGNIFTGNSGHAIRIPCAYLQSLGSNNAITCQAGYGIEIWGVLEQSAITIAKQTVPYYVESNNVIYVYGNLTISPGAVIKFAANSNIEISGTNSRINAVGTATERIVFTTTASSPAAGAWAGIYIAEEAASNCILSYCDISYAGKDSWARGALSIRNKTVTVSNCNISHSQQFGIYLMGTAALSGSSTGNVFTNCTSGNTGTDL
jgi:large repetitive protein